MFEGVADVRFMDLGNCARLEDASIMFPIGRTDRRAEVTCATCPVLAQCRTYHDEIEAGLDRHEISGFIAGETTRARIARRAAARKRELEAVPA